LGKLLRDADIVIDALFGTGNNRPIEGIYKETLQKISEAKQKHYRFKTVAVDLPSGLKPTTAIAISPACKRIIP
jgi:NAD(P)H-hydrate epimerase